MLRIMRWTLLAGAVVFVGAYLVFNARQHRYDTATAAVLASDLRKRDTVVLTGGPRRIRTALELLRDGRTNHVFISGVSKGYRKRNLPSVSGLAQAQKECCITLGFDARDTSGNGKESAAWATLRGTPEIFLVTSRYHMPRAMVELKRWAPSLSITPISVSQDRDIGRQVAEFLKYGAALVRLRFSTPQRSP